MHQSDSINGDDEKLLDDGPIDIDEEDEKPALPSMWGLRHGSSPVQSSGSRDDHGQSHPTEDSKDFFDSSLLQKVGMELSSIVTTSSDIIDHCSGGSGNAIAGPPPSLSMIANLTGGTTGLPTFYAPGVNISSSTPRHSHSHSHAQQHLHESRTPSMMASSPLPNLLPSVAPVLSRSVSYAETNMESYRQTIAEIISQIRQVSLHQPTIISQITISVDSLFCYSCIQEV